MNESSAGLKNYMFSKPGNKLSKFASKPPSSSQKRTIQDKNM